MASTVPLGIDALHGHPVFAARGEEFDYERYLFHYTRWEALVEIAYSGTLRMNRLDRMNDPRESKAWYTGTSGHAGPPDLSQLDMTALLEAIRVLKSRVKAVAFTQDVPSDDMNHPHRGAGFAHPAMWAHYGGNHTGVCIVFDREALIRRVAEESTHHFGSPPTGLSAGPVLYDADVGLNDPIFGLIDINSIRGRGYDAAAREYLGQHGNQIWYHKHSDWSPEVEFRIVYLDYTERDHIEIDINECVAGLVLGVDFAESHLGVVEEFNQRFDLGGCVARSNWWGPRWQMQDLVEVGGRWTWATERRTVRHVGTLVSVVEPPLRGPVARCEPPFNEDETPSEDDGRPNDAVPSP